MERNEERGGAALGWARGIREALPGLAQALAQEEERLRRMDEAWHLGQRAQEVLAAMGWARLREQRDRERYEVRQEKADVTGLVVDIAKGLLGMEMERHHAPARLPFGKVLVAVGPGGFPDGVATVNVSEEARRKGVPEAAVEKALEESGYALLNASEFRELVEDVKQRVEEGAITLPVLLVSDGGSE